MKTAFTFYALLAIVVAADLVWIGFAWRGTSRPALSPSPAAVAETISTTPKPVGPPPSPMRSPDLLTPEEWQKFRTAQSNLLQDNPDIAAEYKGLLAEMEEQKNKLDAAMIKADPKVAPILAKLMASHQQHGGPNGPPPGR